METLLQDIRFALRTLRKTPLVTAIALLSLAIGIGANTTVFTLVKAFFLQSLPVEQPDRLVRVFTSDERNSGTVLGAELPVSYPNYRDIRDRGQHVFSGIAVFQFTGAHFSDGSGEPQQVGGLLVSGDYFEVLGVDAAVGRVFRLGPDAAPGADPVVVLEHGFWQERFGGDPEIVGRTLRLNGHQFTVIGVTPAGFSGIGALGAPSFWVPVNMYREIFPTNLQAWVEERRALIFFAVARLAEGVSMETAQAALTQMATDLREEYPIPNQDRGAVLAPVSDTTMPAQLREASSSAGWLLGTVVAVVLLIACGNVANLLLARSAIRRREIAVRLALGAPSRRLMRQLLTESVVLALGGGALGLLFAWWGRNALWALRPPFLGNASVDISLDTRVLAFTLLLSLVTGVLFGLAPALQAARPQLVAALKNDESPQETKATLGFGLREALVAVQVALSLVALIGAGLFVRSLSEANRIDPGFDVERLATVGVDVGTVGYTAERGREFYDRVQELAAGTPGVESASLSDMVPIAAPGFMRSTLGEGQDRAEVGNGVVTPIAIVSPTFLETLGTKLVLGRGFDSTDREDTRPVAMLNVAGVHRFFPQFVQGEGVQQQVLGRWVQFYGDEIQHEVVGVVADSTLNAIGEEPQALVYLALRQNYRDSLQLTLRTAGDGTSGTQPADLIPILQRELRALEPQLVLNSGTLTEAVETSLWGPRMAATLLAGLGAIALVLACIGIYGVMAQSVQQRHREIGIRMAIGASRSDVLGLVLRRGMMVAAAGLAAGLVLAGLLALGADRRLGDLLFGVEPLDLTVFAVTAALLALVALVANFLPARRATRVNPIRVLRVD